MKKPYLGTLTLSVLLFTFVSPQAAFAQCTEATAWDQYVQTSATMGGQGGSYVGITARTQEPPGDPCNSYLQSEAWINPGGTPTVQSGVGTVDATATKSGNIWGVWTGTTKHWYIYRNTSNSDTWHFKGSLDRSYDLGQPPPPPCDVYTDPTCCENAGYWWNYDTWECVTSSPIVINVKDSAYHFTSAAQGVWFDLAATGKPQRVAWTEPGSTVGFLVLDVNGNGIIDGGAELFGTSTRKRDGTLAANGFDALYDVDGGPGRSDGVINVADSVYWRLRIWFDRNHNGFSEPEELVTLPAAGIAAIYTGYAESRRNDHYGNRYRFEGSVLIVNNQGVQVRRRMYDVYPTMQ